MQSIGQNSGKIGIFDSGVGGLNTLRALRTALPQYNYHYLGDTARAPYGVRGQDELLEFTTEAAEYLREQGCSLVIVACNTASTFAMKSLQQTLHGERDTFRMLGILTPVVEAALAATKNKRIGVIATQSTVDSGKYLREVEKFTSDAQVFQNAAPTLASLIETSASEADIRAALTLAIAPLLDQDIDTLVLGCTHYSHVEQLVRSILPAHIAIVHEAQCIARSLADYLMRHSDFAASLSHRGTCVLETTELSNTFAHFARTAAPAVSVSEAHITHKSQV
jgi:glutamate racemase